MACPQQLQNNSGLAQLQLRWHPHGSCRKTLASLSCSCDGIPTAATQKLSLYTYDCIPTAAEERL